MKKILIFLCSVGLYAHDFQVSVMTVFRNEARFLKEWIEYHKLIGIEHFYLYNNLSEDHFEEILAPYIKEGIVELFDWPIESTSRKSWNRIQGSAMLDAFKRMKGVSKWAASIDVDEFIFVKNKTLLEFLSDFEDYGGVTINWLTFGTSHIKRLREDTLMIEQLVYRSEVSRSNCDYVKSIVQVDFVNTMKDPFYNYHVFPLLKDRINVNARKMPNTDGLRDETKPVDLICIHHYVTRDESFLRNVKLKRPLGLDPGKRSEIDYLYKTTNDVIDRSILIYAKRLREILFKENSF